MQAMSLGEGLGIVRPLMLRTKGGGRGGPLFSLFFAIARVHSRSNPPVIFRCQAFRAGFSLVT